METFKYKKFKGLMKVKETVQIIDSIFPSNITYLYNPIKSYLYISIFNKIYLIGSKGGFIKESVKIFSLVFNFLKIKFLLKILEYFH